MGLVTVDNDEVYAISISQNPGMLAPAINAKIMPDGGDAFDDSVLAYSAPDMIVAIGGVTYDCAPDSVAIDIDPESVGVDIEVQYYPKALRTLRHGGLKKSLVFISCRPYQRTLLENEYNTDTFEILFKDCDVYCSDGWTAAEVMQEIGTRAGLTITCLTPTFHLPQTTIVFQRGQKFLEFILGLLPRNGFEYVWTLDGTTLTVSLIQSAHGTALSFVPGMLRMGVSEQALPPYDFIEITGGDYQYGTSFDFGPSMLIGGSSGDPNGQILSKTLPRESVSTEEGGQTTDVEITYRTGPDGQDMFALLERRTTVQGPYSDSYGNPTTRTIRETVEEYSYENTNVPTYRTPRKTQLDTEVSQYYTRLVDLDLASSQAYVLTEDGAVLSGSEYTALGVDAPNVLIGAIQQYGVSEESTETWEYITEATADWNWHEGMVKKNVVTVSHKFCMVNNIYYDSHMPPKELLQAVLTDLSTSPDADDLDIWMYTSAVTKEGSVTTKTLTFLHEEAYQYEEATLLFDVKAGGMVAQPVIKQVLDTGRVPSSPSDYRTAPMKLTLDTIAADDVTLRSTQNGLGGNDVCFAIFAEIPTNNPVDFRAWASMLMEQVLYGRKDVSMASFDRMLKPGTIAGGATITSVQVTETEGDQAVTMGGVA